MPNAFEPAIVDAVLRHMNDDHTDDSALIVRAFGPFEDVVAATMVGFDSEGADWVAHQADGQAKPVRVAWPDGPIAERPEVRRQIVALYDAACDRLGVSAREHD